MMSEQQSPEFRRKRMSSIKGKDTKPEIVVRKYLFSKGFRYRKNVPTMPGKPDIVLPKYRTCIFVNGCFWHHHGDCKNFVWPKRNKLFWQEKIERNVERDKENYKLLKAEGWNVIIVWECELKRECFESTMKKLTDSIRDNYIKRPI